MLWVPSERRSKATHQPSQRHAQGPSCHWQLQQAHFCPTSELSIVSCGNSRLLFRNVEGPYLILFLTTWPFSAHKCCNAGFLTVLCFFFLIISREADVTQQPIPGDPAEAGEQGAPRAPHASAPRAVTKTAHPPGGQRSAGKYRTGLVSKDREGPDCV